VTTAPIGSMFDRSMRSFAATVVTTAGLAVVAACGTGAPGGPLDSQSFTFGPITILPNQEITDLCVQITLGNDAPLAINRVAFEGGAGFHHSNWFYVPETTFPGDDGVYHCSDRNFDQAAAAFAGGVLFAQSTQAAQDVQQFPPGAALEIPAHEKLVATIHLVNATDATLEARPTLEITPIPPETVTTPLRPMAFEDHALGLPPGQRSRFTLDCDLQQPWDLHRETNRADHPDFHIYYALAHYHAYGTGMTIEAVAPDDTAATMYSTQAVIGDALGGALDPPFAMTGYTRLRFSCDYTNTSTETIGWGNGAAEMCVFLAFTDSDYVWTGGQIEDVAPGPGTMIDNVMTYTSTCSPLAI
jgi:hypothetical protein